MLWRLVLEDLQQVNRFVPLPIDRLMEFTSNTTFRTRRWPSTIVLACLLATATGCHDGPLYGLKVINPYYSQRQWKEDEKYGITDHQRKKELVKLVDSLPRLPAQRQEYWLKNLEQIMEHDESADMRRTAVMAAGQLNHPTADKIVQKGFEDESTKVRIACCQTLANRNDAEATRMLAQAAGSSTNQDVRKEAFVALGKHKGPLATDALRLALEDRDPATRVIAMKSLRSTTGKNYGNEPDAWIAALQGKEVEEQPIRFAERLESMIR
jgi:hypothetical protein